MIREPQFNIPAKVTIFGDGEDKDVTKIIWSLASGKDLVIKNADTVKELEREAAQSLVTFIVLEGKNDDRKSVVKALNKNNDVVCSVIAIVRDSTYDERRTIMAQGFDSIFPLEFLRKEEFQIIFSNKIRKGQTRLKNKVMEQEYRTFSAALSASAAAFIVFDNDRKLFYVSEHYLKAYPSWGHQLVRGIGVMEAYGIYCKEENFTPQNPNYNALTSFWERLDGACDYYGSDGRIYRLRARKLPDSQGTIVITTNITDYVNQQQELEAKSGALIVALQKEQEAGEVQKQFINMISHEFRTPLSIIDGQAQRLSHSAGAGAEDIGKRTKIIRSAVSRLVNLMEGILSSNILKTGHLELVLEAVDLKKLIGDLCETHAALTQKNEIITEFGDISGALRLDKKVVTLIIGNLLSNAIKFSGPGTDITVRAGFDGNGISVSVADKGVGIPEDEQNKIFDRYYRASTSKSKAPGTGLGLNLVRDLTALHGGKVAVESAPGEGACFTIYLPVRPE